MQMSGNQYGRNMEAGLPEETSSRIMRLSKRTSGRPSTCRGASIGIWGNEG
jgi:hypothetical protein